MLRIKGAEDMQSNLMGKKMFWKWMERAKQPPAEWNEFEIKTMKWLRMKSGSERMLEKITLKFCIWMVPFMEHYSGVVKGVTYPDDTRKVHKLLIPREDSWKEQGLPYYFLEN